MNSYIQNRFHIRGWKMVERSKPIKHSFIPSYTMFLGDEDSITISYFGVKSRGSLRNVKFIGLLIESDRIHVYSIYQITYQIIYQIIYHIYIYIYLYNIIYIIYHRYLYSFHWHVGCCLVAQRQGGGLGLEVGCWRSIWRPRLPVVMLFFAV